MGAFVQDDWRLRPNFTVSAGLRYEGQNNIGDHADWAPRLGFAWGIGRSTGTFHQPQTVIRGGFGMFYDRFSEDLVLQSIRLNGILQQQFVVPFPNFYPTAPDLATLSGNRLPQAIRELDRGLRAPYIAQTVISVERQLPQNISVALTYTNSRGVHTLRSRNINAPLAGTFDPRHPESAVRPLENAGNIYLYESSGIFKQNQLVTNLNARVSPRLSLFGFYMLNSARSNTDGAGTFPADQFDLRSEFGRAAFDVRHRFLMGGSIAAPWGLRLSPFVIASSGQPFNITIGRDLNGDLLFTDRPAFAADLSRPSVVRTSFGDFDVNPLPGAVIVPRNFGDGPAQFTVNLRLSKTIGFGESSTAPARRPEGDFGGGRGRAGRGPGGAGRPRVMGGGGRATFADAGSGRRYSLTFTISARNLLNSVNPAPPIGNLSSPLFGQSNALAGGFFANATANRRIELQVRFSF